MDINSIKNAPDLSVLIKNLWSKLFGKKDKDVKPTTTVKKTK